MLRIYNSEIYNCMADVYSFITGVYNWWTSDYLLLSPFLFFYVKHIYLFLPLTIFILFD